MKVGVEDLLSSGNPVCQEEVDALTTYPAVVNGGGEALGDIEHAPAESCAKIGHVGSMNEWNHQKVSGIDRLNVHEGANEFIAINDASGLATRNNLTEDTAVALVGHVG